MSGTSSLVDLLLAASVARIARPRVALRRQHGASAACRPDRELGRQVASARVRPRRPVSSSRGPRRPAVPGELSPSTSRPATVSGSRAARMVRRASDTAQEGASDARAPAGRALRRAKLPHRRPGSAGARQPLVNEIAERTFAVLEVRCHDNVSIDGGLRGRTGSSRRCSPSGAPSRGSRRAGDVALHLRARRASPKGVMLSHGNLAANADCHSASISS